MKAGSCSPLPSPPHRRACRPCVDRREIAADLPIHVLCSWRCPSPGARSALWPGSHDPGVRSRLFQHFATGLGRGACFDAPHRAPSASRQTVASRSLRLTIPIATAVAGGLVQRGLSAANAAAARFSFRAAADKRYSLHGDRIQTPPGYAVMFALSLFNPVAIGARLIAKHELGLCCSPSATQHRLPCPRERKTRMRSRPDQTIVVALRCSMKVTGLSCFGVRSASHSAGVCSGAGVGGSVCSCTRVPREVRSEHRVLKPSGGGSSAA